MITHAWFDVRTLALSVGGSGRPLPIRTNSPQLILLDTVLFIGNMYLLSSLARVPLAWRITRRQMHKAQTEYHLSRCDVLGDGLLRGMFAPAMARCSTKTI